MSWRKILGTAHSGDDAYTQNPHNTQKDPPPANSADTAYCAGEDSKLLEDLATATLGLNITPAEVRNEMAPEDIEDWHRGDINVDTLSLYARLLAQRQEMGQGVVPSHYTEHASCRQCGPIWLWFAAEVEGCPWCWNRVAGRPIPRPGPDGMMINKTGIENLNYGE